MRKSSKPDDPIGVFDSGLGGLTVVKELIRQLPNENIIYFGDTARVPYGTKSKESIVRFSRENTAVLLKHKVKMVVVACNSCSSYALPALRRQFDVPILGVIEAGARKAVVMSKNKRVGIIATSATVNSGKYPETVNYYDASIKTFGQACPLFVPLVEEGWMDKKVTREVAGEYLAPLKRSGVDTLILGCTHYPLLKDVLRRVMGPAVTLIDSAQEIAVEVRNMLESLGLNRRTRKKPGRKFLISDKPQEFKRIASKFLGYEIKQVQLVPSLAS